MPKKTLPHSSWKAKLQSPKGVLMQLMFFMTGSKESNECTGGAHCCTCCVRGKILPWAWIRDLLDTNHAFQQSWKVLKETADWNSAGTKIKFEERKQESTRSPFTWGNWKPFFRHSEVSTVMTLTAVLYKLPQKPSVPLAACYFS